MIYFEFFKNSTFDKNSKRNEKTRTRGVVWKAKTKTVKIHTGKKS